MQTVKLFLTDVDGCMTDGGLYYTEQGDEMKRFCVYDGVALKLLMQAGVRCGIVTGENSEIVRRRAEKLGLDYLYMGVGAFRPGAKTKLQVAEEICEQMNIDMSEVVFVGDDINDLDLLEKVGYPFCPPNAMREVQAVHGIRVTDARGGEGVIREVARWILQ